MVTSDFTPEMEIRPFGACAMKNTQYNAYLWPNRRNFRILIDLTLCYKTPVYLQLIFAVLYTNKIK